VAEGPLRALRKTAFYRLSPRFPSFHTTAPKP
jgi:hypothetical protein